ncbi:MAG: class I SAM-dependent methyltransferase [Candidatus Bathyarchaeota archaeon]|nr:MAG: class I SAM-dependent methyltransferase [Candidatus Bathyarchaeota archaeon]
MKNHPACRRVEQWKIYDRIAGHGIYADVEKEFLPDARYDWTLLAEIELFRSTISGYKRVLDIGCGTGHPSLHIARDVGSIIGIDKSERMIEIARNRLRRSGIDNIVFEVGDAVDLRFINESFDAIILCGSLATLSDKKKSLQEIRRVLKKDGEVACVEANWLYKSVHERYFEGEGSFVLIGTDSIRFRYVRRSVCPNKEVEYRCIVNPGSALGKKLLSNPHFLKHKTLETEMGIEEVEPHCDEIEYDEQESFDVETISNLFAENGFKDIVTVGYGVMYDLLDSAGLVDKMGSFMRKLSRAEATFSRFLDPLKTEMLFLTCKRDSTTTGRKVVKRKEQGLRRISRT